jgi:hypothetical protein
MATLPSWIISGDFMAARDPGAKPLYIMVLDDAAECTLPEMKSINMINVTCLPGHFHNG